MAFGCGHRRHPGRGRCGDALVQREPVEKDQSQARTDYQVTGGEQKMAERNHLTTGQLSSASPQAPERSAEEISRDIASRRESISETVDHLSNRFEQTFDWRTYVADHPLAALGVAAGIGFLASRLLRQRSSSGQRISDALADAVEDLTDRFRYQLDGMGLKRPGLKMTIKAAATGAVARAAAGYLRNRVADRDTNEENSF
jgi:ElaB/YqjD/DUF883 family membrane-anchored ribosome-binding protein